MYFAAALLVLVGCNKKDNALNNAPEGTPFEKGQKVTLTIGTGAQQGPNKVVGVDNTTDGKIDFAWEEGDQILVKVDENTATFTLSSGAGLNEGVFAGEMPAGGSNFDIQYPTTTPNLSTQEYTEEDPIPADKMLFTATGCVLGTPAILKAQYAMVQLNLYGTDMTIGKIVFKNITAEPVESYTLTLPEGGVEIGANSEEATPFYMVVPAGEYKFEVEVYDAAATPAKICSFATSAAKTFTAGECLNMPAKEVKDPYNGHAYIDLGLPSGLKWATMNVGATTPEGYGDYFAWGETSSKDDYSWSTYFDSNDGENFTKYYNGGGKTTLEPENDAAHVNWGGNWRMPTYAELDELKTKCTWTPTTLNNISGFEVKGSNDNTIFLPVAGCYNGSSLYNVISIYWSSSLYESLSKAACGLRFSSGSVDWGNFDRYYGVSVRPVCE